jgi:hypothetical protein
VLGSARGNPLKKKVLEAGQLFVIKLDTFLTSYSMFWLDGLLAGRPMDWLLGWQCQLE